MIADLSKLKANIIYNSPYSPKFAPIEEVFGIIKAKLKGKNVNNSKELIFSVRSILQEISAK